MRKNVLVKTKILMKSVNFFSSFTAPGEPFERDGGKLFVFLNSKHFFYKNDFKKKLRLNFGQNGRTMSQPQSLKVG